MAGFIMNLNSIEKLELYATRGVYGTIIKRPVYNHWAAAYELTLADYLTMRPGDLVFFFHKRGVYGVGRVVGFEVNGIEEAALCNYPGSSFPHADVPHDENVFLWRENGHANIRWVVFLEPYPYFFREHLDMDEILQSDVRGIIKSLPVFYKRSFIAMDDEETRWILDLFLRKFQNIIDFPTEDRVYPDQTAELHRSIHDRQDLANYVIDIDGLVNQYHHEALIEAWLSRYLTIAAPEVEQLFGRWSFVKNQLAASPNKPVDYMDFVDLYGITQRSFFDTHATTISHKLVEIKKDHVTSSSVVDQLLKYVDWSAQTLCGGEYQTIDAYLVAQDFSPSVIEYANTSAARQYVIPRRPYNQQIWRNISLIRYAYTGGRPAITLELL